MHVLAEDGPDPTDEEDEIGQDEFLGEEEAGREEELIEEEVCEEEETGAEVPTEDGGMAEERLFVKENVPEVDKLLNIPLEKYDGRLVILEKLPSSFDGSGDEEKSLLSLSQHSEDSSNSKEEVKKEDDKTAGSDINLQEKEEKCLKELQLIEEVPSEIINSISAIFQKYHEAIEKEQKGKIKAEAELFYKSQKMVKDLQCTTELQAEVNELKRQLEKKDEVVAELKVKLDESHEREQDLIDEKNLMFKKIEQLDKDLDKKLLEDQMKESGTDVKGKTRESYIKEIGRLKRELDILEGRLYQSQSDRSSLEKRLLDKEKEYADMEEMLRGQKYEVMKHEQKKKVVETDLEQALTTMANLKNSVGRHYDTFKKAVHELTKKDEENFELKKALRGLDEQNSTMSKYIIELRDRLEYLSKVYFEVEEQNEKLKNLCSNQTGNLEVIKKKSIDIEKIQEKWVNRLAFVQKRKDAALQEVKKLNNDITFKIKELKHNEMVMMKLNKRINELQKEKDTFSQQIKNISNLLKSQKDNSETQLEVIEKLSEESNKLKLTSENQEKELKDLLQLKKCEEKEKQLVIHQNELVTAELQVTVQQLLNYQKEIKKKEKEIQIITGDYNNILNEKKILQKRLLTSHGLSKDYEFKINYLYSEIEHFKQHIGLKDDRLEKLTHKVKQLEFENAHLDDLIKHGKLDNKSLQGSIAEKEQEKQMLNSLLQKGENMRLVIMRDVDRLRHDTTILRTVIQRRNAELSLLYEKTELMNFIMKNGESEYRQRLADIGLLKTEVSKLRAEKKMLIKTIENNGNLRREMFLLHKELTQEKQKCRALEEQMENPINVHRWRILEGKDPEKKELIEKSQMLQNKLFKAEEKNSSLLEKLHNTEVLYMNLKNYLEKLPGGGDSAANLQEAKRVLRNKTTENQRLAAELAAFQNECRQVKKQLEETVKETDIIKKKYYDLKRHYDHESLKKTDSPPEIKTKPSNQKLFPAGFRSS